MQMSFVNRILKIVYKIFSVFFCPLFYLFAQGHFNNSFDDLLTEKLKIMLSFEISNIAL